MKHFDPDLLRSLAAFADAGTLARAARIVGRTPSAVTAQMQRLEDVAGVPLLKADGRGRVLTEAGQRLVAHARLILSANEEAWLELHGATASGRIAVGVTQDFARNALVRPLAQFARTHPNCKIEVRVGRSSELLELMRREDVDVTITMHGAKPGAIATFIEPMRWIMSRNGLVGPTDELPLAVLDAPCGFRDAAITALGRAGRRYRLAATSPSLSGLQPALIAGLALTVRTARFLDDDLMVAPAKLRLPKLPDAVFAIHARQGGRTDAMRFCEMLIEKLIPTTR